MACQRLSDDMRQWQGALFRRADGNPPGPIVSRTKRGVERLFDTQGRKVSESKMYLDKKYKPCAPWAKPGWHVWIAYYDAGDHWSYNYKAYAEYNPWP